MNTSNVDHRDEQPAELISGVLTDARDYAVAEVDKIKAEVVTHAKHIGEEIKIASVGLMILTVAAIMLGTALSLALVSAGLPGWAGFGIVALVFAGLGILCLNKLKSLVKGGTPSAPAKS